MPAKPKIAMLGIRMGRLAMEGAMIMARGLAQVDCVDVASALRSLEATRRVGAAPLEGANAQAAAK